MANLRANREPLIMKLYDANDLQTKIEFLHITTAIIPLNTTCVLFYQCIFAKSETLNSSKCGDVIKITAVLTYCGFGRNCHVTYMALVALNNECTSANLVGLSHYKRFFEPFSYAEAPSLASSSLAVGRGKPLNENRGERWFHAD